MEDLVEKYIQAAGFKKDVNYFKEMYLKDIEQKWDIDLSALSNQGKAAKRFDFVIKTDNQIYGIETNFYGGGGSKLNETARSYKMLSQEADTIDGFTFVWFTDGIGWKSAKGNLRETFDVMDREVFSWVNTFNIDFIGIIRNTIHDSIGKSTFTITDLLVPFTFTELRTKDC